MLGLVLVSLAGVSWGDCVEGDCFTGKGKFTCANGDVYEGEWKSGYSCPTQIDLEYRE